MKLARQIGIICLNHLAKRNALSAAMADEIMQTLRDFAEQKIHVVILGAAGDTGVWSAGHDISELPLKNRDPLGYFDPLERLLRAVQEFPGPVIAMIHGGVWGGACDLVLTCDIVIGDETCTFAITPAKLGLPYNVTGVLHFMDRLGLNVVKEMFFTADPMPATRAATVGLLNHLVPAAELFDFTLAMATKIAARSPLAVAVIKEQCRILSNAYGIAPETFERIQGLRRTVYDSHDYEEGIRAFLEKRAPVFRGE